MTSLESVAVSGMTLDDLTAAVYTTGSRIAVLASCGTGWSVDLLVPLSRSCRWRETCDERIRPSLTSAYRHGHVVRPGRDSRTPVNTIPGGDGT